MEQTSFSYPVFEPNQVLTSDHLNELREDPDVQIRLTRSVGIGMGIMCGLEPTLKTDGTNVSITITRGSGITSEGYLIVEPLDISYTACRKYTPPSDLGYEPFLNSDLKGTPPFEMLELVETPDLQSKGLDSLKLMTNPMAVLLFLELRKEGLSNCSSGNCDDKGSEVTATVRHLLVSTDILGTIIAKAAGTTGPATTENLEKQLFPLRVLPDLKMPRYNSPNTSPVTSAQVLAGFHASILEKGLVDDLVNGLAGLYGVLKAIFPDLQTEIGAPPSRSERFKFAGSNITNIDNPLFLQYYYDFVDDLIRAYDELRKKAEELICACVPNDQLFPRHLMLGVPRPIPMPDRYIYRQRFLPSPAVGCCRQAAEDTRILFRRLVEMLKQLDDGMLPTWKTPEKTVRITPSKRGNVPLSGRAIPYYYKQTGAPPLYELWSPEKSHQHKAIQNLGYWHGDVNDGAPLFVSDPLRFDLSGMNFLSVEGHIGKDYQSALKDLLALKDEYRLPIEIIALSTGTFDDTLPLDLAKEDCRIQDVMTMYEAFRKELVCQINDVLEKLTVQSAAPAEGANTKAVAHLDLGVATTGPTMKLAIDPALLTGTNNVSAGTKMFSLDMTLDAQADMFHQFLGFASAAEPENLKSLLVSGLISLKTSIDVSLNDVNWANVKKWAEGLSKLSQLISSSTSNIGGLTVAQVTGLLAILSNDCIWESLYAIRDELSRRVTEIKRQLFMTDFLQKHPGIEHGAGVPLGGTFVIVYHNVSANSSVNTKPSTLPWLADLGDNVVIADFYLPYLCCSDCPPIQYVLPKPTIDFGAKLIPTVPSSPSPVVLVTPLGGTGTMFISTDGGASEELKNPLDLAEGAHKLQIADSTGLQSALKTINVPAPLSISEPTYIDDIVKGTYTVNFNVQGGTGNYKLLSGALGSLSQAAYTQSGITSGAKFDVTVTDDLGCSFKVTIDHKVCILPCNGVVKRTAFRLWLQPATGGQSYHTYSVSNTAQIQYNGKTIPLTGVTKLLEAKPEQLNGSFNDSMKRMAENLTQALNTALNKQFGALVRFPGDSQEIPRMTLSYTPNASTDPFALLWIEYFDCIDFDLEFSFTYSIGQPGIPIKGYTQQVEYIKSSSDTSLKVTVKKSDTPILIVPGFGEVQMNRCSGSKPLQSNPGVSPLIGFDIGDGALMGRVDNMDKSQIAAWIWDLPQGRLSGPFGTDIDLEIPIDQINGQVRLTAISVSGGIGNTAKVL